MQEINYQVEFLTEEKFRLFKGLYSDFIAHAISDYHFELSPLTYEEFIEAVSNDTIKCIILSENTIPTAFLVYVTAISESVELNMIHCLGEEDIVLKKNKLMEFFLNSTKSQRENSVVCYPMLGSQSEYASDISNLGFKLIGLLVLRFLFDDPISLMIFDKLELPEFDDKYKLVSWNDLYFDAVAKVINNTFANTSDALFDTRFTTLDGTKDILDKIVNDVYGDFLPDASSILLYDGEVVGVALANITGGKIANIPLVGLMPEHRGKELSVYMLRKVIATLLDKVKTGKKYFSEVNVTTETDNSGALKMYRNVGFREDYSYIQAYLPK